MIRLLTDFELIKRELISWSLLVTSSVSSKHQRCSPAGFEEVSCHTVRGPHGKELRWPAESDSQYEKGTSVLQPLEQSSTNPVNDPGCGFFPRASR